MKRLVVLALFLLLAGCGSEAIVGVASDPTPEPSTTVPASTPAPIETTEPPPTPTPRVTDAAAQLQRDALTAARDRWADNQPASYSFTYRLQCECDQGPWRVTVDADGRATEEHLGAPEVTSEAPYLSIDALFDGIEAALDDGRYPIEVDYDATTGVPLEYVYNRPELPIDGGFILVVDEFTAAGEDPRDADRAAFEAATDLWEAAGISGEYDYTFSRSCFCPPEYVGPYRATTINGVVVAASLDGIDLFDVEVLNVNAYGDLVLTVDQVFAEIDRAIDDAALYTVEYHPELGYPTNVFIDWKTNVADEEVGYQISDLASGTRGCSTAVVNIRLVPQPDLPDPVEQRRQQIFDAALTCNIDALAALTNVDGFNASFGGGEAADIWADAESRGEPVLLDLVRHLNLSYTVSGEGSDALYTWPSAFQDLEAADGTGLDPADYEGLLQLYSVDELDAMFNGLGSYAGYRIGIDADGNWLFFVAGD